MRPFPASALAAWTCLAASLAAGCGVARRNAPEEAPRCFACHGGLSGNAAPPAATVGPSDRSNPRVGAHQAHLAATAGRGLIACETCHPVPPASGTATATHLNGHADVVFGTFAAPGPSPAWDPAARTCSVTCHGAALAGGGDLVIPTWTAVDGAAARCGACHGLPPPSHPAAVVECRGCHLDTLLASGAIDVAGGKHLDGVVEARAHGAGWADPASPDFHGLAADRGLGGCAGCHGADLSGGGARVACAGCHGDGWRTRCTMCHGGTDDASGAPPRTVLGQEADPIRVGAHRAHLAGGPLAAPLGCGACHVTPADALDAGHVDEVAAGADPLATVTFGDLAVARGAAPAWDRATATCSATYCHGATLRGGSVPAPSWTTLDGSQAACGACHGAPPPSPHPAAADQAACHLCHPGTVDAAGAVIPPASGGLHLDATVEAQGHPASWMDPGSAGFHAGSANDGLASCQACHGADLSGGGVGVACASCHGARFATRCTGCHGGVDDTSGAPPRNTWGRDADPVRTGAHRRHLAPGPSSPALGCDACHVTPSDIFTPGHITASPTADVTFGTLARQGAAPAWQRASATCAGVYCHGATLQGGAVPAPSWTTLDGSQAACGACHGTPPPAPHPAASACHDCHPATVDAAGALVARASGGRHVDGAVQIAGHDIGTWLDTAGAGFHAYAANDGLASCQACHGADLSGGAAGVSCAACHGAGFTSRCTGCHGGTANATGAPPRATWGQGGDPIRTGAHTAHVTAGPLAGAFGCGVCHAVPLDATSPGHVTASPTAAVALTGLAAQETPAAAFVRAGPSCVTYCHGASLQGGTLTTPAWTTLDGTQAACGTCHGLPPTSGKHWHVTDPAADLDCWDCHGTGFYSGTKPTTPPTPAAVNAALHVNGTRDVGPNITSWDGVSCTSVCHGRRTW